MGARQHDGRRVREGGEGDGALVGVQRLYEAMRQVGQGVGKLSVARGFRMALGEIEDPKGVQTS